MKAICGPLCGHVPEPHNNDACMADRLGGPAEGVPELYAFATHLNLGQLEQFTQEAQLEDSVLRVIRETLNTGQ